MSFKINFSYILNILNKKKCRPTPCHEGIQYVDDDDDEEPLFDKNDLHVLDYKPTLKILCIDVILKHNLDTSILPEVIR